MGLNIKAPSGQVSGIDSVTTMARQNHVISTLRTGKFVCAQEVISKQKQIKRQQYRIYHWKKVYRWKFFCVKLWQQNVSSLICFTVHLLCLLIICNVYLPQHQRGGTVPAASIYTSATICKCTCGASVCTASLCTTATFTVYCRYP